MSAAGIYTWKAVGSDGRKPANISINIYQGTPRRDICTQNVYSTAVASETAAKSTLAPAASSTPAGSKGGLPSSPGFLFGDSRDSSGIPMGFLGTRYERGAARKERKSRNQMVIYTKYKDKYDLQAVSKYLLTGTLEQGT